MKILDSDHCIAILRGKLDLRGRIPPRESLAITTISIGELTHGAHKSAKSGDNLTRLDVLIEMCEVLPFDEQAARLFGRTKANLERQGQRLAYLDLQIASIAISLGAPLVTHNQCHFARIPDLQLEDWLV